MTEYNMIYEKILDNNGLILYIQYSFSEQVRSMFDSLSDKLESVFKKLRGRGVLKEEDVKEALREVRLALLEADVNFKVVKDFIDRIQERAVGQETLSSLTPSQQVVKIVHEELVGLL